jgi:hypothetical protein
MAGPEGAVLDRQDAGTDGVIPGVAETSSDIPVIRPDMTYPVQETSTDVPNESSGPEADPDANPAGDETVDEHEGDLLTAEGKVSRTLHAAAEARRTFQQDGDEEQYHIRLRELADELEIDDEIVTALSDEAYDRYLRFNAIDSNFEDEINRRTLEDPDASQAGFYAERDEAEDDYRLVNELIIQGKNEDIEGNELFQEADTLYGELIENGWPRDSGFRDRLRSWIPSIPRGEGGSHRARRTGDFLMRHKKAVAIVGGLALGALIYKDNSGSVNNFVANLAHGFGNHHSSTGGSSVVSPPRGTAVSAGAEHLHGAQGTSVAKGIQQVGVPHGQEYINNPDATHILHYEPGPHGGSIIRLEGADPAHLLGHKDLHAFITLTEKNGTRQFYEVPLKNGQVEVSGALGRLIEHRDVMVQITNGKEKIFSSAMSNGYRVSGHEAGVISQAVHARGQGGNATAGAGIPGEGSGSSLTKLEADAIIGGAGVALAAGALLNRNTRRRYERREARYQRGRTSESIHRSPSPPIAPSERAQTRAAINQALAERERANQERVTRLEATVQRLTDEVARLTALLAAREAGAEEATPRPAGDEDDPARRLAAARQTQRLEIARDEAERLRNGDTDNPLSVVLSQDMARLARETFDRAADLASVRGDRLSADAERFADVAAVNDAIQQRYIEIRARGLSRDEVTAVRAGVARMTQLPEGSGRIRSPDDGGTVADYTRAIEQIARDQWRTGNPSAPMTEADAYALIMANGMATTMNAQELYNYLTSAS